MFSADGLVLLVRAPPSATGEVVLVGGLLAVQLVESAVTDAPQRLTLIAGFLGVGDREFFHEVLLSSKRLRGRCGLPDELPV